MVVADGSLYFAASVAETHDQSFELASVLGKLLFGHPDPYVGVQLQLG